MEIMSQGQVPDSPLHVQCSLVINLARRIERSCPESPRQALSKDLDLVKIKARMKCIAAGIWLFLKTGGVMNDLGVPFRVLGAQ